MQMRTDQDNYFDEISRLAHEDPPFAVRLLALANSASSSPISPVMSIKPALSRVGSSNVASFISSLAVQRVFMPTSTEQTPLWRHSVGVAVVMETIARLKPSLKLDRGQAYLVGLLHDIGRFVMLEHAPKNLKKVDDAHWTTPDELIAADIDVFEYTHSELGYLACMHWGLPRELCQIVRDHHEPPKERGDAGSSATYTQCLEIADKLELLLLSGAGKTFTSETGSMARLTTNIEREVLDGSTAGDLMSAKRLA